VGTNPQAAKLAAAGQAGGGPHPPLRSRLLTADHSAPRCAAGGVTWAWTVEFYFRQTQQF